MCELLNSNDRAAAPSGGGTSNPYTQLLNHGKKKAVRERGVGGGQPARTGRDGGGLDLFALGRGSGEVRRCMPGVWSRGLRGYGMRSREFER